MREENNILTRVANSLKESYEKSNQKYQLKVQKEREIYQAQLKQQIYQIMLLLQSDLFKALKGNHYNGLQKINIPSNIRVKNFVQNRGIIYQYSMAKINTEPLGNGVLNIICNAMNTDIQQARHSMALNLGEEYLSCTFPFLYHDIIILGIKDIATDIIIAVISNFNPF